MLSHFHAIRRPTVGCLTAVTLTLLALGAHAGSLNTLYRFGGAPDGDHPSGGLVLDKAGNLYGSTQFGGDKQCLFQENPLGCGSVFRLSQSGGRWVEKQLTMFHGFSDGVVPVGSLAWDPNGALVGVTAAGGNETSVTPGNGTVFRIANGGANWNRNNLYVFPGDDGNLQPSGPVAVDTASTIYGAVASSSFKLKSVNGTWLNTTIATDGSAAGLLAGPNGTLFGTSKLGGAHQYGFVYELIFSNGHWQQKTLYSFAGGSDGNGPSAGLVMDSQGVLYGTTVQGGGCSQGLFGCGAVFQLSPPTGTQTHWHEKILYRFAGGGDGLYPAGNLALAGSGKLYGATVNGGSGCSGNPLGCGIIFQLTESGSGWSKATAYNFQGASDGQYPSSGLTLGPNGVLYGETGDGATGAAFGTVFAYQP